MSPNPPNPAKTTHPRAPWQNATWAGLASYLDSATIVTTAVALVITRALTAGFAVVTPSIAVASPQLLVGLLVVFVAVSGMIGALVIPALERSRGTEPWARAPEGATVPAANVA